MAAADGGSGSENVLAAFPAFGALQGLTIIDTGPLTSDALAADIARDRTPLVPK